MPAGLTTVARTSPPRFRTPTTIVLSLPPVPVILRARTSLCMFRALPPINVSSTSTVPSNLSKLPVCIASLILCNMNHADFCVMPSARPSSCDEMPFFELAISQTAGSHLSSPSGESSKMVPTLTLNCFLQSLHFHSRRVVRYECVFAAAPRAYRAVRPPQGRHEVVGDVQVSEVSRRLQER